jgi:hypothetical protein
MGRIIKPGEIRQQCNSIIQAMQRENQQLQDILPSIRRFLEESTLEGAAWDGLKSQVEGQQSLIQGLICANEELIADSECLANSVGDEDLDEDEITRQLELARMYMGSYQEIIDNYEQDFHFHSTNIIQNDFGMCNHCRRQIRLYTKLATTQQQIIRRMEEKLQRIIDIENATKGLYQGGTSLYASYEQGLEALKGNWNGSEYGVLPYAPWQKTLDERWNLRQEKKAETYLLEEGVTQVQIDNMKKLGYSVVELKMQWEEFETKEDKEFYLLLMTQTDESFAKAFQIDPNKLSGAATMAMANYAVRIVDYPEILQGFNQGIVSAIDDYIYPDTYDRSSLTYRDVYMDRLIGGLGVISEIHSACLTSDYTELMNRGINPEEHEIYKEAYRTYEKCLGLRNFFIAEQLSIETIQDKEFGFGNGVCLPEVSNIKYQHGSISCDFSYLQGPNGAYPGQYRDTSIDTSLLRHPEDYESLKMLLSFDRIHKEREKLLGKYILNGGKSVALAALGLYGGGLPLVAASAGVQLLEKKPGMVDGLDTLATSASGLSNLTENQKKLTKLGVQSGNILLKDALDYLQEEKRLDDELWLLREQAKMKWFGTGGKYRDAYGNLGLSFAGIQDPKVKYYLNQWEKEGISSWLDIGKEEKEEKILEKALIKLEEESEEKGLINSERRKSLMTQIIYGGFRIEGEMDMEDFTKCIDVLNEAANIKCKTEWLYIMK